MAAQFSLMGLLAAVGLWGLRAGSDPGSPLAWRIVAGAALIAAAAVGAAALAANPPGNFNVRPVPREGGRLVTSGIYRWIRHPMYSAVLLGGLGCVLLTPPAGTGVLAVALLAWAALVAVLWLKSGVEERWMAEAHPGYAEYQRATRRFVPGLV